MVITSRRRQALTVKLENLTTQMEQAVASRESARAEGDLSENSAFELACRECERLGAEIIELQKTIDTAQVVEDIDVSRADLLTKVTVKMHTAGVGEVTKSVNLVNDGEGAPPNYVSVTSPMGSALRGLRVGDAFTYQDHLFRKWEGTVLSVEESE